MASDSKRKASSRDLAFYLGGLAGIGLLGAISTEIAGIPTFHLGALFAAHVVLTGLAVLAAALEFTRERLGEGTATAAMALAVVLTFVDLANGFWYYAPFLGIASLLSIFAVVNRFMERDEQRHAARMFV